MSLSRRQFLERLAAITATTAVTPALLDALDRAAPRRRYVHGATLSTPAKAPIITAVPRRITVRGHDQFGTYVEFTVPEDGLTIRSTIAPGAKAAYAANAPQPLWYLGHHADLWVNDIPMRSIEVVFEPPPHFEAVLSRPVR